MSFKKLVTLIATTVLLVSCASKQEKALEKKMSETTTASSHEEVNQRARQNIVDSNQLTEDQKTQLVALQDRTREKMKEVTAESVKLHELLVNAFGNTKEDRKMVNTIQKRMVKNSKRRLDVIFNSMREANRILGREKSIDRSQLMNDLYFEHMNR